MLRHAVAIFFWASAVFVFILSLRGELLEEREKKNGKPSGKH
ncbi:MAG TPA: hypothetical protein VKG87_12190 [Terriglobales bacterium]|jgi:hypothetical protein|nr:hypothetical protein [Terriglobales bacterium]